MIHLTLRECLLEPVRPCKAFAELDYADPVRADQIAEPGQITTQIIEHLLRDDLVITDLTGHNPNVFYELSLRHAIAKPVVQMGGIPLPFDIHASRTLCTRPQGGDEQRQRFRGSSAGLGKASLMSHNRDNHVHNSPQR